MVERPYFSDFALLYLLYHLLSLENANAIFLLHVVNRSNLYLSQRSKPKKHEEEGIIYDFIP